MKARPDIEAHRQGPDEGIRRGWIPAVIAMAVLACGRESPTAPLAAEARWSARSLWTADASSEIRSLGMANGGNRSFLIWSSTGSGATSGVWATVGESDDRWGPPTRLDGAGGGARIGTSGDGRALTVWVRESALWWSRWDGSGWAAPERLAAGQRPYSPTLSVDTAGNALVAWADLPLLKVAAYRVNSGWQPPQVVATVSATVSADVLAAAFEGTEAATIWSATSVGIQGAHSSTVSVRWLDGQWVTAAIGGLASADAAVHRSGATVAALAFSSGVAVLVAPRGREWGPHQALGGRGTLALARSMTGEVGLLHSDSSGGAGDVWYRRFQESAFGEGTLVRRAPAGLDIWSLALGLSDEGAAASWLETMGSSGRYEVWGASAGAAGPWSAAERLDSALGPCASAVFGRIAASSATGRATVAWADRGCGPQSLWVAHRPLR